MPRVVDVEQRRTELAAAVARVIARSGIEGATMRQVAAEAGWTTGTLVHYFTDKRELLQFTLGESLDRRRAQRFDRVGLAPRDAIRHTLDQRAADHRRVAAALDRHALRSPPRPTATSTWPPPSATPTGSSASYLARLLLDDDASLDRDAVGTSRPSA